MVSYCFGSSLNLILIITQPAWDVFEKFQSDLHWERHLSETSQKRRLFCDVFKTSQIHLKNTFILSKISLESICDYSKIFHKSGFVSLRIFLDNLFVGKETSVPLASIGQGIMQ